MIVLIGPMLDIIATLFEPIRFIPFDIKKPGMTVAITANKSPYQT